jgi:hypothetical protein
MIDAPTANLEQWTVIYTEPGDIGWQFWRCFAEDSEHAEEQFANALPAAALLWVNRGLSTVMSLDDDEA